MNETAPHTTRTAIRPLWETRVAPSRITARKASFSAVSGSALMNGCTIAGKRSYEKNTPENIHIGIITKLISPLTLSIFCARLAVSNPNRRTKPRPRSNQHDARNDPSTRI